MLPLLISLCLGCHAKVHRTRVGRALMAPLLLKLWREQHPRGQVQAALDFGEEQLPPRPVLLFPEEVAGYHGEPRDNP